MLPSYQKLSQTAYMLRMSENEIFAVELKPATEETIRGQIKQQKEELNNLYYQTSKATIVSTNIQIIQPVSTDEILTSTSVK
jgi:hypothetical protein